MLGDEIIDSYENKTIKHCKLTKINTSYSNRKNVGLRLIGMVVIKVDERRGSPIRVVSCYYCNPIMRHCLSGKLCGDQCNIYNSENIQNIENHDPKFT